MLITIEGVSGTGKTTLVQALDTHLRHAGRHVVDLAAQEEATEDHAWRLGHLMRSTPTPFSPIEAALLYSARTAGRARLAQAYLSRQPDTVVLADRLAVSLAVQLRRAAIEPGTCERLLALTSRGLPAATTILLETSHAEHMRRLRARGHSPLDADQFRYLRDAFRAEYERCGRSGTRIDTTGVGVDDVLAAALHAVDRELAKRVPR